jgi:hypothetical protein
MPREKAETAAKHGVPEGDTGVRGSESDLDATGAEAPEEEQEDFVLSEETLDKLPPKERAIAARLLRMERENAELRASLSNGDEDAEEDEDDFEDAPTPEIEEIPVEGYEKMAPVLKKLLGGLIQENKRLHSRLDQMEDGRTKADRMGEFKTFKRLHPEWQKYDGEMARIAKTFGAVPQTIEQLEELLDLAKARAEKPSLEAQIANARKTAPNPNLKTPSPGLRGRMAVARNGRKPSNIREAFEQNWEKVMRDNPV